MIKPTTSEAVTEYYVVFTQGVTHWVTKWLKPNFSHIFLITHDQYNWLLLNPTRLYLQPTILPIPLDESPLPVLVKPTDSVLKIVFRKRDDTQQFGAFGMLNCVTWSKYILGIRIKCLTPWRLFKTLLNFKPQDMGSHGIISIEKVEI